MSGYEGNHNNTRDDASQDATGSGVTGDGAAPGETLQGSACEGCALHVGRRDFIREAGAMAIAALALMGPDRAAAAALPIRRLRALSARGETLVYALPTTDGVHVDNTYEVIVARYRGRIYAFYQSCPHQHTALRWVASKDEFVCPKHHSKYGPDGVYISGRATRSMDRYDPSIQGGRVVVDYAHRYRQDKNPAQWAAAWVAVPQGA